MVRMGVLVCCMTSLRKWSIPTPDVSAKMRLAMEAESDCTMQERNEECVTVMVLAGKS